MQSTDFLKGLKIRPVLIFIIIFILLSLSGCVHIDLGNPFKTSEELPTDFHVITKAGFPMNHTFNTFEDGDLTFTDTQPFYVYEHTQWVNISIDVILNTGETINFSIFNLSSFERFVHVIITDPYDEVYFEEHFLYTGDAFFPLTPPTAGGWVVAVEAKGVGYQDIRDFYGINVIAYEPVL